MLKTIDYKYKQLYDILKKDIKESLSKGEKQLPSESQLKRRYGLSVNTIRQALGKLEQDGFIYRLQGKGCFINEEMIDERIKGIYMLWFGIDPSDDIFTRMIKLTFPPHLKKDFSFMIRVCPKIDKNTIEMELKKAENIPGIDCITANAAAFDENLLNKFLSSRYPVTFIGDFKVKGFPGISYNQITGDNYSPGANAVNYLADKGHAKISAFTGSLEYYFNAESLEGMRCAADERNIRLNIVEFPRGMSAMKKSEKLKLYRSRLEEHLQTEYKNDAILFSGLPSGPGMIYKLIKETGLDIPGDISLMSNGKSKHITYCKEDIAILFDAFYKRMYEIIETPDNMKKIKVDMFTGVKDKGTVKDISS
jgi:GntR family transcriptional regulator of arabinose operon